MRNGVAYGFLHRNHANSGGFGPGGPPDFAPGHHVGGLALASTAYGTVFHRIRLAATGTADNARHVLVTHEAAFYGHRLHLADTVASLFYFGFKARHILIFLGFFLEEPCLDFRIGSHFFRIKTDAHAFARMFVKKRNSIAAQIMYFHPAIADAAQGEQLHGVWQAFAGLHHGFEKRAFRDMLFGELYHISAHKQSGRGVAMKVFRQPPKFVERIGTDIHAFLQCCCPCRSGCECCFDPV